MKRKGTTKKSPSKWMISICDHEGKQNPNWKTVTFLCWKPIPVPSFFLKAWRFQFADLSTQTEKTWDQKVQFCISILHFYLKWGYFQAWYLHEPFLEDDTNSRHLQSGWNHRWDLEEYWRPFQELCENDQKDFQNTVPSFRISQQYILQCYLVHALR